MNEFWKQINPISNSSLYETAVTKICIFINLYYNGSFFSFEFLDNARG